MNTIEQKSQEYAEKVFFENANVATQKPWPEFKETYKQAFLAGAEEALKSQWIKVGAGQHLPKDRQKIIMAKRYRNPKTGVWHDNLIIADTYSEKDGFFYEDVWAWMPVPQLPDFI